MKFTVPHKEQIYSFVDKYFGTLAAAVIFIVVVVGFTQIIMPTWQDIRGVDVLNVEEKQVQLDEAQRFLSELKTMRDAYEQIDYTDIKRLEEVLPRGFERDRLFLQLQTFGEEAGFAVTGLAFTANQTVTDASRRQASTTDTSKASTRVEQAVINMSVQGIDSYDSFLTFLELVESYTPVLELSSINYPITDSASFSFTTYYLAE